LLWASARRSWLTRVASTAVTLAAWRGRAQCHVSGAMQECGGGAVRCGSADEGPAPEASMKFVRTVVVFDRGGLIESEPWARVHETIVTAVQRIVHPPGNDRFVIRRKVL